MNKERGYHKVRAAGAVVWRQNGDAPLEIAIIHRPRYGDWSLPKGKFEPGEIAPLAAVREIQEEIGFAVKLGRHLNTVRYSLPPAADGLPTDKTVDYFSAEAVAGQFEVNEEVDELRWLTPTQAENILSQQKDLQIVRDFCALPAQLKTVLLVRHAEAGTAEEWTGDDNLRPLTPQGLKQAESLRLMSRAFVPTKVFAAPLIRCVQTVQGIAEDLGATVHPEPLLSEAGYWVDPALGAKRFAQIVSEENTPVISSQGDVIPHLVSDLIDQAGLRLTADQVNKTGRAASKKGSLWLLSFQLNENAEPRLVAANYWPSTLPDAHSH